MFPSLGCSVVLFHAIIIFLWVLKVNGNRKNQLCMSYLGLLSSPQLWKRYSVSAKPCGWTLTSGGFGLVEDNMSCSREEQFSGVYCQPWIHFLLLFQQTLEGSEQLRIWRMSSWSTIRMSECLCFLWRQWIRTHPRIFQLLEVFLMGLLTESSKAVFSISLAILTIMSSGPDLSRGSIFYGSSS